VYTLEQLADTLCESSRRNARSAYDMVAWPAAVDAEQHWFMSPELCSLYGTELWSRLDEPSQKRLAFFEAVNFFSLNIHGESMLMQGLALRLYRTRTSPVTQYLHHFLDEENKHSVLFGTFCQRYAKVYPDLKVVGALDPADSVASDFLFFAKVLIFEEIVDHYNLTMSKDVRLHEIAVAINANHHYEEARHLAFGRRMCAELWTDEGWDEPARAAAREHLQQFFAVTWREYWNPRVYQDAKLTDALGGSDAAPNPWQIRRLAWEAPVNLEARRERSHKCATFLKRNSILSELDFT
jgi:hypothetical protein